MDCLVEFVSFEGEGKSFWQIILLRSKIESFYEHFEIVTFAN